MRCNRRIPAARERGAVEDRSLTGMKPRDHPVEPAYLSPTSVVEVDARFFIPDNRLDGVPL